MKYSSLNRVRLIPFGFAILLMLISGCEHHIKEYITDPIDKGMDREIENDITTPEDRNAVLKQSQSDQASKSISFPRSKTDRQPFKKGQFVTHYVEDEKGYKSNQLYRVYILDVVGDRVTFELNIWDSDRNRGRRPLFRAWAIEVSGLPKQIPLVLSKEWQEENRKKIVLHSYRELRPNGAIYKQQFDGSVAKAWNDWSADVLLSQYVFLYEGEPKSHGACSTPAIDSTGCTAFEGRSMGVFRSDEQQAGYMHSGVPITGIVSSEGSINKTKLSVVNFGMSKKSYIANLPLTTESEAEIRKEHDTAKVVNETVEDVKAIWLLWQPGNPPGGDFELLSPFIGCGSGMSFEIGAHVGYRFLKHGPVQIFNNSLSIEAEMSRGYFGRGQYYDVRNHLASDIRWDIHFHKLWTPYLGLGLASDFYVHKNSVNNTSKFGLYAKTGSFFRIGQRFMLRFETDSESMKRLAVTYTF